MASVPDPTYFLLLTFMQMVKASGYVSAHSTPVGIKDCQLVKVLGVSPVDMQQERGIEALSTVVRMLANVKLVSLVWQHTQSDQHVSSKKSNVILQSSIVHIFYYNLHNCSYSLCKEM